MPITWDSKLETGIDVIDTQHKRIVAYVNQLEEAKSRGDKAMVGEVISQLVDYTQSHFGFEEAMMEQAGYRFLKPHQKVHEIFVRRVSDFTLRAAKGENIVDELHDVLTTWLLNHIAGEDHDYAESVKAMLIKLAEGKSSDQEKHGFLTNMVGRFFTK